MLSRGNLEATILRGRVVDRDKDGDEEGGVAGPAGLLILVRLETVAPRHLEIDLVLEHDRGLTEKLSRGVAQQPMEQPIESGMKRAEVLDTLHKARPSVDEAELAVHHVSARHFRRVEELRRPAVQIGDHRAIEQAAENK